MSRQRQRIRPTPAQIKQLRGLFDGIPVAQRYDWSSPEGRRFLTYVRSIAADGVPVSWLAHELGVPPNHLHVLLSRYRVGVA